MKPTPFRRLLLLAALLAPVLAHAHPGHDGDHGFGWDFDHFASYPLATVLCAGLLAAAAWAVWQLRRSRRTKDEPVASQVRTRR